MTETVNEVLQSETPVNLDGIERALASVDDPHPTIEAAVTALVFRKTISGWRGLLDAFIHHKCRERIDVLVPHLVEVGAAEHAAAISDLRQAIQLSDTKIKSSNIIDWLDVNPRIGALAEKLEAELDSVDDIIWKYLQGCSDALLDIPIQPTEKGLLGRLIGFFTRSDTQIVR